MKQSALAALLASTGAIAFCVPAAAQSGSAPASEAADMGDTDISLQEIVVTAQRRAQNLQDVPVAVTALTSDDIQTSGVMDFSSLNQAVPGFQTSQQAFAGVGFLRGVGSTAANIGMEPPIAFYQDDVYIPYGPTGAFDFNNIQSVEVLKGPQGTLFGRNATGGVIHLKTREPTQETTVDAALSYDNFETIQAQAYASTGIGKGIAFNIAGHYLKQNQGWGTNFADGTETFVREGYGVHAKLSADLGPDTSMLLSGQINHRETNQGLALRVGQGVFSRGGYSPDALGAGYWDTTSNTDDPIRTTYRRFSMRATHEFENAKLVSITSYQKIHLFAFIDADSTPAPFIRVDADNGGRTFTQEVQLLSQDDAKVQWILGGFYMKDKSRYQLVTTGQAVPTPIFSRSIEDTESFSGFAQASFEILPKTQMTLGVRYTSDKRSLDGRANQGATNYGPFLASKTFRSVTGRFSIDHKFSDDIMGYVAYNRGFKSGLFNIAAISAGSTAAPAPVEPEELDAYTIGFKSELADRRIRLNVEAYYYDYRNLQTQNVNPNGTTVLLNGGKATIKGVDVEATFRATQRLTINASMSVADGQYDSFQNGLQFFPLPPNPPIPIPAGCAATVPVYPPAAGASPLAQRSCDLSGNKTIQTPPFSSNVAMTYDLPTSSGDFSFTASWTRAGNFFWEAGNQPYAKQPKTNIVAASAQWSLLGDAFSVRIWGRNLTNEKYATYAANSTTSGYKYSPAEPRTYGVTLSAHY